jgi:hypothetical protein
VHSAYLSIINLPYLFSSATCENLVHNIDLVHNIARAHHNIDLVLNRTRAHHNLAILLPGALVKI